jgi:two-component system sensor histidine kinase CreC
LSVKAELDETLCIRGQRFLVRQALANLLQNAIAFSPSGGTVTVSLDRDGAFARVLIRDHGPGIPGYALAKVFDRFYSLPHPDTGVKGSGLGLTFVREIALLHGGEARLENDPGGGAIATLRFPCGSVPVV